MGAFAPMNLSTIGVSSKLITSSATVAGDRSFIPDVINPQGVARWMYQAPSTIPDAFPFVTMQVKRPVNGSPNYKVTMVLGVPTLETLGTASSSGYLPGQKVGYQCTARVEFTLPGRSTQTERQTLLSLLRSALSETIEASDALPLENTSSPLIAAVTVLQTVY